FRPEVKHREGKRENRTVTATSDSSKPVATTFDRVVALPNHQQPQYPGGGQLNTVDRKYVASSDSSSDIAWFTDGSIVLGGGGGGGDGETSKSSKWNKTTSKQQRSRTKGRSGVTALGAATVIWIAVSHLIHGIVAHSLEFDPPHSSNATSNAGYGNAYSNRFGRLLLNGTRVVATGSLSTSTTNHHTTTTDRGLFDGGVEYVPADGTASAGFNDSSEMPQIPEYIRATSMVFCIIIMCLGVIGNIMVPIVILKTKDMRNSTNIFLTNLSIADLLVLLVCTPTVLVEVNSPPEVWVLGEEMSKIVSHVKKKPAILTPTGGKEKKPAKGYGACPGQFRNPIANLSMPINGTAHRVVPPVDLTEIVRAFEGGKTPKVTCTLRYLRGPTTFRTQIVSASRCRA
uniref:G-protein coupled receptors family 1 profile domain-containing protein n=1 Tax=Anopheles culicifacies TaxID=139723 RepID=A0A182MCK2_9DIPT